MKRFLKLISVLLVLSIALAVPVLAQETAAPYASLYFASYGAYLYRTSSTSFQIWFEVTTNGIMSQVGVSSIVLERSVNGGAWTAVKTYTPSNYSNMLCSNTAFHDGYVKYNGSSVYDFRAYVTFYASNSSGYSERSVYAYFI